MVALLILSPASEPQPQAWAPPVLGGLKNKNGLPLSHSSRYSIWPGSYPKPGKALFIKASPSGSRNSETGQLVGLICFHSSFSNLDLLNGKNMQTYLDDPKRTNIFSTHNSTWADVKNLNSLLISEECRMRIS